MKKGAETNDEVQDIIRRFRDFTWGEKDQVIIDESEFLSRSPTRAKDPKRDPKPYARSGCMRSTFHDGITEVVELEVPPHREQQGIAPFVQTPQPLAPQSEHEVGLQDVGEWVNRCNRNPQTWKEFLDNVSEDFDSRATPVQLPTTPALTAQWWRSDGVSIPSTTSSVISSPPQSLSEYNGTSPEFFGYEESSLYNYAPASGPLPDSVCVEVTKKTDETLSSRFLREEPTVPNYNGRCTVSGETVLVNNPPAVLTNPSPESATPNIGTLMLNLANDNYESTIDLNQFASEIRSEPEPVYQAKERDALNKLLDPEIKRLAWARINQLDADSLVKGDRDGDTQLMILLVSDKPILEYVYVIVERLLKEDPSYLECRNHMNQDALFHSALLSDVDPVVTSYIAEALIRGKKDVNKQYNCGNSILHYLAMRGDASANILERLLTLKTHDNVPAFNVNSKNNEGYTPLHVACKVHKPCSGVKSYKIVRILEENGAVSTEKDYKEEDTPAHLVLKESFDLELLKILFGNSCKFQTKDPTTIIPDRQGNTVLHLACKRNSVDIQVQKEVVKFLLRYGAMINLKNINGYVPSALVESSRKKERPIQMVHLSRGQPGGGVISIFDVQFVQLRMSGEKPRFRVPKEIKTILRKCRKKMKEV